MKALVILNLEDCSFEDIDDANIKAINLVAEDKETGEEFEFEWEDGFKIMPMPQKRIIDTTLKCDGYDNYIESALARGYNACIDEILGEEK